MTIRATHSVFIALLLGTSGFVAASDADLATAFRRVAHFDSSAYLVGRDQLISRGVKILPFLKTRANSADWRERDLARGLIAEFERPADVARWRLAVGNWKQTFLATREGVVVSFPMTSEPVSDGRIEKSGKLLVGPECLPFLIEYQRQLEQWAASYLHPKKSERRNGYRLLALFADASSADSLVSYLHQHDETELKSTIVALGTKAQAALWRCVQAAPNAADLERKTDRFQRTAIYRRLTAGERAVPLLAQIADEEVLAKLLGRLRQSLSGRQALTIIRALSARGYETAIPRALLELEKASALAGNRSSNFDADYNQLRSALLSFGEKALPHLARMMEPNNSAVRRALATGLIFEIKAHEKAAAFYHSLGQMQAENYSVRGVSALGLAPRTAAPEFTAAELEQRGRNQFWQRQFPGPLAGPSTTPIALRIERTASLGMSLDLAEIAKRPDALSFRLAADGLLRLHQSDKAGPAVAVNLATAGKVEALEVYDSLLDARRAARYADAVVESCLILENPKALPLLAKLLSLAKSKRTRIPETTVASASLVASLLKGETTMEALLRHQQAAVRRVAAKKMARKGDARALPVLLRAAITSTADRHLEYRAALTQFGPGAEKFLRGRLTESDNWREKLVCESALLRLHDSDLVKRFAQAAAIRTRGFHSRLGPVMDDYRHSGYRVADHVTDKGIPLLEATLAFETKEINFGIAAFALARFKRERSLKAVVAAMRQPGFVRGGSIGAEALREFGPPGVAAAKTVPRENVNKANYQARSRRRRGATRVLAKAQAKQSVENLLRAFEKVYQPNEKPPAEPYRDWRQRMQGYLRIAAAVDDKRLVQPLLRFAGHADDSLAREALTALRRYRQPKIVKAALKALRTRRYGYEREPALLILIEQLGATLEASLLRELRQAIPAAERARLLAAIQGLVEKDSLWRATGLDTGASLERMKVVRGRFRGYLLKEVASDNQLVSAAAAEALTRYDVEDDEVTRAIAKWTGGQTKPSSHVVNRLASSRKPYAGRALLLAYRKGERRSTSLVRAIGRMEFKPATDDLIAVVQKSLGTGDSRRLSAEISTLAVLGERGLNVVRDVIEKSHDLSIRVHAARSLASSRYKDAFETLRRLLDEVVAAGVDHPHIPTRLSAVRRVELVQRLTYGLADSLLQLDSRRAYPLLAKSTVGSPTNDLAARLAYRALSGKPRPKGK